MENTVPIIIPAYEPDKKLIGLLEELKKESLYPVILVDDGSDADTYNEIFEEARSRYNVTLLKHAVNLGKGRALKDAFNYCLNEYPLLLGVVTADSDGQHHPEDIKRCIDELKAYPEDLIMGCRDFDRSGIPARSVFGNKVTSRVMSALAGVSVSDTQTGLRAIPREFMKILLSEKGERFEFETNMLLRAREEGVNIREVSIKTIYLDDNKSSHFRPIRDSVMIYAVFGKFLVSSFSSSILDMLLFALFCRLLRGMDIGIIGYIMLSTILARVISATYNFLINLKVVFKGKGSKARAAVRYVILAAVIMGLSGTLVSLFHGMLSTVPEVVVKIPVDCMLFLLSFYMQREIVYK